MPATVRASQNFAVVLLETSRSDEKRQKKRRDPVDDPVDRIKSDCRGKLGGVVLAE
jgi:hypothetical protein